ncbi:MAG: T9SS type A sorting domain-containing protein [Ignavibacteriales bacterium]|nr:T9SS type A sorting domain-containing protein [Ignavibacteriales bacterium]
MKTLICFLLLACSISFGQSQVNTDSSPDPMDFYPYRVGDVWQYLNMPGWEYTTSTITRIDTVSAGIHLIYRDDSDIPFAKVDLDNSIVYRNVGEDLWITSYKLADPLKSYWIVDSLRNDWTYFYNDEPTQFLGQERESRRYLTFHDVPFGDTSSMYGTVTQLVDGLGEALIQYEIGEVRLTGCIINGVQYGVILSVDDGQNTLLPEDIKLHVYPNPFNPETVIRFSLPVAGYTKGVVYDVLGKEMATLLNGDMSAGNHEVRFNAIDLSSGVYFFRLESGNFSSAIKMVVGK